MANTKILDLPATTLLNDADVLPVVQSGTTKRTTVDMLLDKADVRTAATLSNELSGGFATPSFLNNFIAGSIQPKIYTVGFEQRMIFFAGSVDTSLAGVSSTNVPKNMFRLAVAHRPKTEMRFTLATQNNGTFTALPVVGITPDGYVTLYPGNYPYTGTSADINLAGISYFIAP